MRVLLPANSGGNTKISPSRLLGLILSRVNGQ